MSNSANMESLLSQISTIWGKHDYLAAANGEGFNLFTILDMERSEVKAHEAMLYELLNPHGSHRQGRVFLDLFFKKVLGVNSCSEQSVKVEAEHTIKNGRRIDLYIECGGVAYGIEMKIDAGDGEEQLDDYHKYLIGKNPNSRLFYLTLFGTKAASHSASDEDKYTPLSFAKEIKDWLSDCIKEVALKPALREAIRQYQTLIEKITNQTTESAAMEIAQTVLKNESNFIAYQELLKSQKAIDSVMVESIYKFLSHERNGEFEWDDGWKSESCLKIRLLSPEKTVVWIFFDKLFNPLSFQLRQFSNTPAETRFGYQKKSCDEVHWDLLEKLLACNEKNEYKINFSGDWYIAQLDLQSPSDFSDRTPFAFVADMSQFPKYRELRDSYNWILSVINAP